MCGLSATAPICAVERALRATVATDPPAPAARVGYCCSHHPGGSMRPPAFLYGLYERRLTRALQGAQLPHHVGLMLDGNRRWARSAGLETAQGHQAGADRIADLLGWCEDVGIERVTLWMLSTDNLRREEREVADLLEIIAATVAKLATTRRWRLQLVGELHLLPAEIADRLRSEERRVGEGGRGRVRGGAAGA